jgi:hypothetical protein
MTLDQLIEDHRQLYRSDLHIDRLVSRQPPTSLDLNNGQLHEEPAAAIGMSMSGRLLRLLGHPEGYRGAHPWLEAWHKLRWNCRRNHPYHRAGDRPYWRGSLCHELVRFVIVDDWSVHNASKILRYDNPEPVLRSALSFIEQSIDDARRKAEQRAREDEGKFTIYDEPPHHHAVPGLHQDECPQCRRNAA